MTALIDELRREFAQLADDVTNRLILSQQRGDQRAVDFFKGQATAFRRTLEHIAEMDRKAHP